MLLGVFGTAHVDKQEREHSFSVRVGSIDENTVIEAELDKDNTLWLLLKGYRSSEWTEERITAELVVDQTGLHISHPMGFCLSYTQREKLMRIFDERQYYGMTGWQFVCEYAKDMCVKRGCDAPILKEPNFSKLPVLEDGYRGIYDRWYSGPETDCLLMNIINYPLGGNTFAFVVSNNSFTPEPVYLKVLEFKDPVMSREVHRIKYYSPAREYDVESTDEICRWCRISLTKAEYITGMDECMMLTARQRDRLIKALRLEWPEMRDDYNCFAAELTGRTDKLTDSFQIPDYSLLPVTSEEVE